MNVCVYVRVYVYVDKVEVVAVDLGGQTPSISNVKLADFPSSRAMPNDNTSSVTMVATFDLTVPSPDSRIVLRARVGKKWCEFL